MTPPKVYCALLYPLLEFRMDLFINCRKFQTNAGPEKLKMSLLEINGDF